MFPDCYPLNCLLTKSGSSLCVTKPLAPLREPKSLHHIWAIGSVYSIGYSKTFNIHYSFCHIESYAIYNKFKLLLFEHRKNYFSKKIDERKILGALTTEPSSLQTHSNLCHLASSVRRVDEFHSVTFWCDCTLIPVQKQPKNNLTKKCVSTGQSQVD